MKRIFSVLSLISLGLFLTWGYCEVSFYVGKRIIIRGPEDFLPAGLTFEAGVWIRQTYNPTSELMKNIRFNQNVINISNDLPAVLLYLDSDYRLAKVRLSAGIYKGMKVWVPLEWIDYSQRRYIFQENNLSPRIKIDMEKDKK